VIELDALAAMHESVGTNAKCRDVRYTWLHRTKRADGARRSDRRREHIAELNKRAAEADLRLKRLYDAIETGVADLGDPGLKERIAGLKAIRDQAQADTMRAQAELDRAAFAVLFWTGGRGGLSTALILRRNFFCFRRKPRFKPRNG
jgi:hypothetical protein